jgi:RHS repeat-associated protein
MACRFARLPRLRLNLCFMPVETFEDFVTRNNVLTRNFVGAPGLEAISTTQNTLKNTAYPMYDTNGNMTATLSLTANGTGWNIANERSFDVWGSVRSGATTGGPKGRYVANLGHVLDDESGWIFMRAYEPESGRFVSQDVARQGLNWFTYCANDPVNKVDSTGKYWWLVLGLALVGALAGMAAYAVYQQQYGDPITPGGLAAAAVGGAFAGVCAGLIALTAGVASAAAAGALILEAIAVGVVSVAAAALCGKMAGAIDGKKVAMSFSPIDHAVACIMGYQFLLAAEMSGE